MKLLFVIMKCLQALLLFSVFHLLTITNVYSQSELEWIEKGDDYIGASKYEDAVAAYINALTQNFDNQSTRKKLLEAERHVEYSFLIDESQLEKTAIQYFSLFGDRGKYFTQVRHDLSNAYRTKAYNHSQKNEVTLIEAVHREYKKNLGASESEIEGWLTLAAQDSASKAEDGKDWEAAIRYNTLVMSNTRQRREFEKAKERLAIAQKNVGKGLLSCTASSRQNIFSSSNNSVITTSSAPKMRRKYVVYNSNADEVSIPIDELILILDPNNTLPSMLVFSDKGKTFCTSSESSPLLNFPNHFSYRALTKDRKIITAGIAQYTRIVSEQSHRSLVSDNINKVPLAEIYTKDLVIEAFRQKHPFQYNYEIIVHVSPSELMQYRDEIISWMKKEYLELGNVSEGSVAEGEMDRYETDVVIDTTSNDGESVLDLVGGGGLAGGSEKEKDAADASPSILPDGVVAETSEEDNPNIGKRSVPKLEDKITKEERLEIQVQAEEKLLELESSFKKLTNRQLNSSQKQRVRESTVENLFINDRATVSVSSTRSSDIKYYPIPTYLLRLENMISGAYQQVEIQFSEIHKVSNFKPNPDGTWTAVVTFTQEFKGYHDVDGNKLAYSDITQKNVVVRIRRVEIFTGNANPDVYWEVLLADIGVSQTEPFND